MCDHHKEHMEMAEFISKKSLDPSTKVGAVITLGNEMVSLGYNQIAKGIPHYVDQLNNREWKYSRIIHAEQEAVMKLLTSRVYQQNWGDSYHIYTTHHPCDRCAAMIIHAGIKEVFTRQITPEMLTRWPGMKTANLMFREAGIPITFLDV